MVLQVNLVYLFFVQRKFKMTVLSFSTFLCMMAIIIVFKNEIISNTEMIKNKNTLFFFFLFGFAALSQNSRSSCVRFIFHTFERWKAESAIFLSLDFFNISCLKLLPVCCSCDYIFQSSFCSKKGHKSLTKSQLDRYQGIYTSDTQ